MHMSYHVNESIVNFGDVKIGFKTVFRTGDQPYKKSILNPVLNLVLNTLRTRPVLGLGIGYGFKTWLKTCT